MRYLRTLCVLCALCLCVGLVSAQASGIDANKVAQSIDQRSTANGLPNGDGQISYAEQQAATGLATAIQNYDQQNTDYEAIDAETAAEIREVEESIATNGEPTDQEFNDSFRGALAGKLNRLIADMEHKTAQNNDSPFTSDEEYELFIRPLEEEVARLQAENQKNLSNTLKEAAAENINNSNIKHKNIVKRRVYRLVDRLIQIDVPSQNLPINGYWRVKPFEITTSGQCVNAWGDNDGPPNYGDPAQNPGEPLCGYANEGGLPFIVWRGLDHPYLPGTSSTYSRVPETRTQTVRNRDGKTIGTIKVTTQVEYEVVAPDLIRVTYLMQEEGGCSMRAEYYLELVTADDSVCKAPQPFSTPLPTPTLGITATPEPGATQAPVEEGKRYRVILPDMQNEDGCTDKNRPPQLTEVRLIEQADGSLLIDYGTGTQLVYPESEGFYAYNSGIGGERRESITVTVDADGTGTLAWSINDYNGNICYVFMGIALPGVTSPYDPTATPEATTTPEAVVVSPDVAKGAALNGQYAAEWLPLNDISCSKAIQPLVPTFTELTIEAQDEATLTIDYGAGQYTVDDPMNVGMYMVESDEQDGVIATVILYSAPGELSLIWTAIHQDDSSLFCSTLALLKRSQ